MGTLIGGWIGTAITFFAAGLFLKFYYNSKMSRFYKKKWVIVACSFMVLYAIIEGITAYRDYAQGRPPIKGELQKAIAANNTLVTQDFAYNSPDAYTLVVPAGYAYTTFPSGALSLIAIKKQSQSSTQSAIVVARQQGRDDLETLTEEIIKVLKKKNSTYAFSSESQLSISDLRVPNTHRQSTLICDRIKKYPIPIKLPTSVILLSGPNRFFVVMKFTRI